MSFLSLPLIPHQHSRELGNESSSEMDSLRSQLRHSQSELEGQRAELTTQLATVSRLVSNNPQLGFSKTWLKYSNLFELSLVDHLYMIEYMCIYT